MGQRLRFRGIVSGHGACHDPFSNKEKCMSEAGTGKPLPTWDQTQCKCKPEYMKHYRDGTWVNSNKGSPCPPTAQVDFATRFATIRTPLAVLLTVWVFLIA